MNMHQLQSILGETRLIPVVTPHSVQATLETAKALRAGGIRAIEITLRAPCALDAVHAVLELGGDFVVGAGTVTHVRELEELRRLGAHFAVSPGMSTVLAEAARESRVPLIPGIATASELMTGLTAGYDFFKVYPAEAINAEQLIRAFAAPFPEACFCPTGGINLTNIDPYLRLANVVCVGGSWMVPDAAVQSGDFEAVTMLSREAIARTRPGRSPVVAL